MFTSINEATLMRRNIQSACRLFGSHHIKTYFCTDRFDYLPYAHIHPLTSYSNAFYFERVHFTSFDTLFRHLISTLPSLFTFRIMPPLAWMQKKNKRGATRKEFLIRLMHTLSPRLYYLKYNFSMDSSRYPLVASSPLRFTFV